MITNSASICVWAVRGHSLQPWQYGITVWYIIPVRVCVCVCVDEGIVFKYFWGDVDTNTHTHIHIIHTIFYSHYSLSLPHTHTNTHIFCHNQYIKCFKSVFNIWLRSNMVFLFYLIIGLKCYPAAQIKPEWGRREIIKKKKGHAQIHLQGVREKLSFFFYNILPSLLSQLPARGARKGRI